MKEEKEKGVFNVVEWSVENFTSWNAEIHGNVIESPEFERSYVERFELYPRGLSGCGDHLVVRVLNYALSFPFFHLSFLGPDGSVVCSLQVTASETDTEETFRDLDLPPGPEFRDVLTKIREEEALHGDRLTLRCRREETAVHVERRAFTTIQTMDATLKISTPAFSDIIRDDRSRWISKISNPLDTHMGSMNVWVVRDETDESKLGLELDPLIYGNVPLVWTRATVMSHDRAVRTQEVEHLARDKMKWTVLDSMTVDEVEKDGFSLLLRMKIIPGIGYRHSHISALEFTTCVSDGMPTIASGCRFSSIYEEGEKPETAGAVLSKELSCLYKDRDFSDFQLKCGDVSFPVHKAILSSRSPVFKSMFSSPMVEAASGCMDIVDLDPSTLGVFLAFLYTGAVEKDLQWESALKLYYAADKYLVPSLKRECADVLCANLSISNVCDILSLADRHQDSYLATGSREFVLKNYNEVLKSDEWGSFSRNEPSLAEETLCHLDKKKA